MNRVLGMAAVVACAASVSVVAARDDYKTITVTGCVQNISSTGASGVTQRGFLLSNPAIAQSPSPGAPMPTPTTDTTAAGIPTGTSGTAAAGMPTSGTWVATTGTSTGPTLRAKSSYRLEGSDDDLKAQVGHKVEITGAIVPKPDNAPKSEAEHLQVTTMKMLATNCSK